MLQLIFPPTKFISHDHASNNIAFSVYGYLISVSRILKGVALDKVRQCIKSDFTLKEAKTTHLRQAMNSKRSRRRTYIMHLENIRSVSPSGSCN